MTTLILHGELKALHPEPIEVEANSIAEAVSYLNLLPAFRSLGKKHLVRIKGVDSEDALFDKRVVDVVEIHPVVAGAGKWGQVILGIVIIAVAVINPAILGTVGISQGTLALTGVMMVLGGILQALAPQPPGLRQEDKSKYLSGQKNTATIGTPIPMIIGRHKAYGQYLSWNIDAADLNSAPEDWYSSPFTNDDGELTYSATGPSSTPTPPDEEYGTPQATFQGISYPASLTDPFAIYLNFTPTTLLAGPYDMNFDDGTILHVENSTAGTSTQVILAGGEPQTYPVVGTGVTFTRNYG